MQRDNYIDAVCGLIIWMIIGHAIGNYELKDSLMYIVGNHLFPFFMPWFFYKAGNYHVHHVEKRVISGGGVKRLLVPWLVFTIITYFIFHLYRLPLDGFFENIEIFIAPILQTGAPVCNVALWFLLTLFFVKILFNEIERLDVSSHSICLITLLLAFVLNIVTTYSISFNKMPNYFYNTITGLSFYAGGVSLKKFQYDGRVFIMAILLYLVLFFTSFSFVDMFSNRLIVGSYVIWLISSLFGCVAINNIFMWLDGILSFKVLSYVGRNSMIFYTVHLLIIAFLNRTVFRLSQFDNPCLKMFTALIVCAILLPLFNVLLHTRKMKWMIGE